MQKKSNLYTPPDQISAFPIYERTLIINCITPIKGYIILNNLSFSEYSKFFLSHITIEKTLKFFKRNFFAKFSEYSKFFLSHIIIEKTFKFF
jgi:hypothetical protein